MERVYYSHKHAHVGGCHQEDSDILDFLWKKDQRIIITGDGENVLSVPFKIIIWKQEPLSSLGWKCFGARLGGFLSPQ